MALAARNADTPGVKLVKLVGAWLVLALAAGGVAAATTHGTQVKPPAVAFHGGSAPAMKAPTLGAATGESSDSESGTTGNVVLGNEVYSPLAKAKSLDAALKFEAFIADPETQKQVGNILGQRLPTVKSVLQDPNFTKLPSYTTYNARLTFEPANGDWWVALSGTNVTDKFYWQQYSPEITVNATTGAITNAAPPGRAGVPSAPRMWALTIQKNF